MPSTFRIIFASFTLALVFASGCSKSISENSVINDQDYAEAGIHLNNRNYERAIEQYEKIVEKHPESIDAKRKLMHAYAGASGFEVAQFYQQLKFALEKLEQHSNRDFKSELAEFERKHLRGATSSAQDLQNFRRIGICRDLLEVMARIPDLNLRQRQRLEQALKMYSDLGFTPETSSKEDNFKWGILFSYRIAVNVKHQVQILNEAMIKGNDYSWQNSKSMSIFLANQIFSDAKMAYHLFQNSYGKLEEITIAVDRFLNKATDGKFHSTLIFQASSSSELLEMFLRNNRENLGILISQIESEFENAELDLILKQIFHKQEIRNPEISYRKDRINAIVQVFLEEIDLSQSNAIREGRILSESVWVELRPALEDLARTGSPRQIQNLLRSRDARLSRLQVLGKMLLDDSASEAAARDIRSELEFLQPKVDKIQVQIFFQRAQNLLKDSKHLGKNYLRDQAPALRILKLKLAAKGKTIEMLLDSQLAADWKALVAAIESDNSDSAQMNRDAAGINNYLGR